MKKTRRYDIEGAILEIPVYYDARTEKYMEDYPDFLENPVYTPDGCPIPVSYTHLTLPTT